jgi:SH3 domain-containing YSC84-like protein 1
MSSAGDEIEQDEVRWRSGADAQRLVAGVDDRDVMAFARKQSLEESGANLVVAATRMFAGKLTACRAVQNDGPKSRVVGVVAFLVDSAIPEDNMRGTIALVLLALSAVDSRAAGVSAKEAKRIEEAATVLKEIHTVPDKDIPQELWDRAECVVVIPALKKAAFVLGAEYGNGLMSCRHSGEWSAPVFMQLGKGSWGVQIGAQTIDLVLLVMNANGMEKMLRNKVSLGAEASVAAGPVGRDARAATDAQLKAEILSYSRAQGLFAGINLSGGMLKPDDDDNTDLYGPSVEARDVVMAGTVVPPPATEPFMAALKLRSQ